MMKRILLSVFCFLLITPLGLAIDFTLSDSSIDWTDQISLEMSISNIATAGGVDLKLYVDVDGNGSVNGDDFLLTVFEVDDGEQNPFGAETLVDDKDGVADGAIETAVPLFSSSFNAMKTIGSYVWEAVEIDESDAPVGTASAAFEVTQPTGTVWVSGQVCNYRTQGNTIPGAHVQMEYFSDTVGSAPAVWADDSGSFKLYLPEGASPHDVGMVFASAKGMMSAEYNPYINEGVSATVITQALETGENVLPDLFVAPEYPTLELCTVQGTVYRVESWGSETETNAISGVMVDCDMDGEPGALSWDITDSNGQFSLVLPDSNETELWCESSLLTMRGIVGSSIPIEVSGPVSGIEIYLHDAEAMVRGQVTAQESGDPLTGVELFFDAPSTNYMSSAVTSTNGTYEAGLLAGTYNGECEEDGLHPLGYLSPPLTNGLVVGEGTVVSNVNFQVARGYSLSGTVLDTNSIPLTDGYVVLVEDRGYEHWLGEADVRFDGYYKLLSPTGNVYLKTQEFGDYYVDQYHLNQPLLDIRDINPLEMTTNGLSHVNFNLSIGARVEGVVRYNETDDAEWLRIDAMIRDESNRWIRVSSGQTDWDGEFGFAVPAENDVYLRTDVDYNWNAPRTWYGDTCSGDLATALSLSAETTTSNLYIAVSSGYNAHGSVLDHSGMSAVADAEITAYDGASNRYDTVYSDSTGSYNFFLPTGTVLYVHADADGYEGEFYENTYTLGDAYAHSGIAAYSDIYLQFRLYATTTDSDGDGLPDYLEDSVPDGDYNPDHDYSFRFMNDTDDDGVNDSDEYIAGTSSQDPSSLFKITDLAAPAGELSWSSVAGRRYTVKFTEDLAGGSWSNLYSVTATGPQTSFTNAWPSETGYLRIDVSIE